MKLKYKIIFITVLMLLIIYICSSTSFGASSSAFNEWVEQNKEQLTVLLDGYDYVIVNNYWQNYVAMYYTNAKNNKFYLGEDYLVNGNRRYMLSRSDLGNNYYGIVNFNPSNNNTFQCPSSLATSFNSVSGDSRIINNYSASSILYSSKDVYDKNCSGVIFEKKALPLLQKEVVVGEIVKVEQITETANKVAKMIIPIGLVVLSIGLLIYVIKSVILRMT